MVKGLKSNWQLATSGTCLVLFKILVTIGSSKYPANGLPNEYIGGVADMLDSRAAILRGLHSLEMWVNGTLDNFNEDKK